MPSLAPALAAPRAPRLLPWPPGVPWIERTVAVLLGLAGALGTLFYANLVYRFLIDPSHMTDFFAFRSWSGMVHSVAHPTDLYDPARVRDYLKAVRPGFKGHYPFAYPPSFLLMIWPLGTIGPQIGAVVWMLASLVIYVGALAEAPWRRPIALGLLILPATALAASGGQDGLIFAALLGGACRVLPRRPVLAGVLFGLAACKPQFGVLVPLALVAARQWRAIAAATATVLAGVVASGLAFGFAMWARWPESLFGLADFARESARLSPLMPTVSANLRLLHLAPPVVLAAQLGAGAVAACCVWAAWRRGPGRMAGAVLLVGAFLATPYAFFYDLTILDAGLLALALDGMERGRRLSVTELAALGAMAILPLAMNATGKGWLPALPLSLPVLAAVFVLVVRRALRREAAVSLDRCAAGPA